MLKNSLFQFKTDFKSDIKVVKHHRYVICNVLFLNLIQIERNKLCCYLIKREIF